jgi:hypothetical protein
MIMNIRVARTVQYETSFDLDHPFYSPSMELDAASRELYSIPHPACRMFGRVNKFLGVGG